MEEQILKYSRLDDVINLSEVNRGLLNIIRNSEEFWREQYNKLIGIPITDEKIKGSDVILKLSKDMYKKKKGVKKLGYSKYHDERIETLELKIEKHKIELEKLKERKKLNNVNLEKLFKSWNEKGNEKGHKKKGENKNKIFGAKCIGDSIFNSNAKYDVQQI